MHTQMHTHTCTHRCTHTHSHTHAHIHTLVLLFSHSLTSTHKLSLMQITHPPSKTHLLLHTHTPTHCHTYSHTLTVLLSTVYISSVSIHSVFEYYNTSYLYTKMKWCRLAQDNTGVERYVQSVQDQEWMRLLFRKKIVSAGLLEDKKRRRMVSDERCAMCDSGVGVGLAHFLFVCGEFERDWLVLLDDVCRIVWARVRLDEFGERARRKMCHCCWEKGWRAYSTEWWRMWESVYCIGWVYGSREGSNCCVGRLLLDIGHRPSCHLSPSLNSQRV